jgi:hypothetical protein
MTEEKSTLYKIKQMAEDFACELTHETGAVVVFEDASVIISNDRKESPELVIKFKIRGLRG